MKRILYVILYVCIIFSWGCSQQFLVNKPKPCRVVTGVRIEIQDDEESAEILYLEHRKISKALNYLRKLNAWDRLSISPEEIHDHRYTITVHYSDGTDKQYQQIGYACYREDKGPWLIISPDLGIRLALLTASVPSDTI